MSSLLDGDATHSGVFVAGGGGVSLSQLTVKTGLTPFYINNTTLGFKAGQVLHNGRLRAKSTTTTAVFASILDAGSPTTASWYYLYVTTDTAGSEPEFIASASAPVLGINGYVHPGDTNSKFLGSVRINESGNIKQFARSDDGKVLWLDHTAGNPSTGDDWITSDPVGWGTFSIAKWCPPTAWCVWVTMQHEGTDKLRANGTIITNGQFSLSDDDGGGYRVAVNLTGGTPQVIDFDGSNDSSVIYSYEENV